MAADLTSILSLEVPLIVRLAERPITLEDVLALVPGAILELPKTSEEELDVLVNNRSIGKGHAVKIGENFGIEITQILGSVLRVKALSDSAVVDEVDDSTDEGEHAPETVGQDAAS